jgi:uncharacterized protein YfcZ (UPF0381/DUF406 family)
MKRYLILLILLTFSMPVYAATIYKWVDKDGVVNFTDDYDRVPPFYRDRVQKEGREDLQEPVPPAPSPQTPPPKGEEARTDIYGRDEAWFRDKVYLWKEKLNAATENYERAQKEFAERAEWLVRVRYGSKTQYEMISYTLSGLTKQLEEYRAQIAEAEKMLDELSKEAERAKANPEWLEPGIAPTAQEIASTKKEKINADLYGRDQTWWREKVRPWKEQLKEATQNYEKAQEEFIKQGEGLGPSRFGKLSLTQYQMISSKQTASNDQMAKYQAQIAEAKEMLEKLSKEAKETNADPAWLE